MLFLGDNYWNFSTEKSNGNVQKLDRFIVIFEHGVLSNFATALP
jgi:hypothetical protein